MKLITKIEGDWEVTKSPDVPDFEKKVHLKTGEVWIRELDWHRGVDTEKKQKR